MWQRPGVGPGRPQRETCNPSAASHAAAAVLGHAGGAKTCCRAQPKQAGARGCNTQAATLSSPRGAGLQPTQHADSRRPIVACRLRCPSDGGRSTGAPLKGGSRQEQAPSPACCVSKLALVPGTGTFCADLTGKHTGACAQRNSKDCFRRSRVVWAECKCRPAGSRRPSPPEQATVHAVLLLHCDAHPATHALPPRHSCWLPQRGCAGV